MDNIRFEIFLKRFRLDCDKFSMGHSSTHFKRYDVEFFSSTQSRYEIEKISCVIFVWYCICARWSGEQFIY